MLESEFTQPRPDCPHPERWHAYDDQSTEVEVIQLAAALVRALQPDVVLETGTHRGFMAEAIGMALHQNGQGTLITMEPDPELHAVASQRCAAWPVRVLQRESLAVHPDVIRTLAPGHVGFAWFDSLLDLRAAELEHFSPLFDSRTIVGFHDAGPHHGEWSNELRNHPRLRSLDLPTPRGCLLAQVC